MSAWLVRDETINHIADLLVDGFNGKTGIVSWDTKTNCAYLLKMMNHQALLEKYGDEYDEVVVEDIHYGPFPVAPIQSLKHIACYLYQCSNGSCPEQKLYKEVEELQDQIGSYIINNLPEYNNAKWE